MRIVRITRTTGVSPGTAVDAGQVVRTVAGAGRRILPAAGAVDALGAANRGARRAARLSLWPLWRPPPTLLASCMAEIEDNVDRELFRNMEKLRQLRIEHRDLDEVIARLSLDLHVDELQLKRLKKRKLNLKDQIARLESQLIPDLNA